MTSSGRVDGKRGRVVSNLKVKNKGGVMRSFNLVVPLEHVQDVPYGFPDAEAVSVVNGRKLFSLELINVDGDEFISYVDGLVKQFDSDLEVVVLSEKVVDKGNVISFFECEVVWRKGGVKKKLMTPKFIAGIEDYHDIEFLGRIANALNSDLSVAEVSFSAPAFSEKTGLTDTIAVLYDTTKYPSTTIHQHVGVREVIREIEKEYHALEK